MTQPSTEPSGSTRQSPGRSQALPIALAVALGIVLLALIAYVLLRDDAGDLADGLTGVEVGAEVEGDDLLVVDTNQGVGVLVETAEGPVYVRYGDDTVDRFGIGQRVDVEGEVAAATELDESERELVEGDRYVVAEELEPEALQ